MDVKEILRHCDHTLLAPVSTQAEILRVCDEAVQWGCASVCIPPSYVGDAAERLQDTEVKVCTVIGFPNGYNSTQTKVLEVGDAIFRGAHEVDTVIPLGLVKDARWEALSDELAQLRGAASGRVLKVIVEACLLTEKEKLILCELVTKDGADYIKTSTGFSTGGASVEDVTLFRRWIGPEVKIKASGGIRTFAFAQALLEAGADRLGASALVPLAMEQAAVKYGNASGEEKASQ